MSAAPLKRRPLKDPDVLPFVGDLGILRGRIHEFCGPSRVTAAMLLAQASEGVIMWIAPDFAREKLHAEGVRAFIDPARLIFVSPEREVDLLWAKEEVLRSGTVSLVITDMLRPPALTPVRRLTLAAEAGAALGNTRPVGVLLTGGDGGAAGIESRWHLAPRHHGEDKCWHLERRRARLDAPRAWSLRHDKTGISLKPAKMEME